ncbi:MAG: ParA family partition ATPase [Chromatiales bacterium]|jgi:chromosome partitioning protein
MPVIAIVGNKGGAGKTTLTINLSAMLSHDHDVVILDADPQRSSLQWRDIAEIHPSLAVIEATDDVGKVLGRIRNQYRYCMIDCPPSVHSTQMQQALRVADLALVPVQPSPLDIWATVHIEEEIERSRKDNPVLNALLVINQLEPRTKLSRIMRRAMDELSLPAAETEIRRRAAYRNSFLEGRTAHDMGASGVAASEEIQNLIQEMEKYL